LCILIGSSVILGDVSFVADGAPSISGVRNCLVSLMEEKRTVGELVGQN
jgi:hypothetical protein